MAQFFGNLVAASLIAIAGGGIAKPALAQERAQYWGSTSFGASRAAIIKPISVTALDDLEFGGIAVGSNQGGSVTVLPETGPAEYQGAAAPVCTGAGGCTANPALFHVTGERGRGYTIAVPQTVHAELVGGGGPSLPVSDLTSRSRNLPDGHFRGVLDSGGSDEIRIGGTLAVPAATKPGKYRAEVSLVVNYD